MMKEKIKVQNYIKVSNTGMPTLRRLINAVKNHVQIFA